ncbi:hypothetical protein BOX15_Mlig017885g2, partial [Macrostomum lignano]
MKTRCASRAQKVKRQPRSNNGRVSKANRQQMRLSRIDLSPETTLALSSVAVIQKQICPQVNQQQSQQQDQQAHLVEALDSTLAVSHVESLGGNKRQSKRRGQTGLTDSPNSTVNCPTLSSSLLRSPAITSRPSAAAAAATKQNAVRVVKRRHRRKISSVSFADSSNATAGTDDKENERVAAAADVKQSPTVVNKSKSAKTLVASSATTVSTAVGSTESQINRAPPNLSLSSIACDSEATAYGNFAMSTMVYQRGRSRDRARPAEKLSLPTSGQTKTNKSHERNSNLLASLSPKQDAEPDARHSRSGQRTKKRLDGKSKATLLLDSIAMQSSGVSECVSMSDDIHQPDDAASCTNIDSTIKADALAQKQPSMASVAGCESAIASLNLSASIDKSLEPRAIIAASGAPSAPAQGGSRSCCQFDRSRERSRKLAAARNSLLKSCLLRNSCRSADRGLTNQSVESTNKSVSCKEQLSSSSVVKNLTDLSTSQKSQNRKFADGQSIEELIASSTSQSCKPRAVSLSDSQANVESASVVKQKADSVRSYSSAHYSGLSTNSADALGVSIYVSQDDSFSQSSSNDSDLTSDDSKSSTTTGESVVVAGECTDKTASKSYDNCQASTPSRANVAVSLACATSELCDDEVQLQPVASQLSSKSRPSLHQERSRICDASQLSLKPEKSQLSESRRSSLQPDRSQLGDSIHLSLQPEKSQLGDSNRPSPQPGSLQLGDSNRLSLQPDSSQLGDSNRPSLQPDRSQLSESRRPSQQPERSQISYSQRPSLQRDRSQHEDSNRLSLQPEETQLSESRRSSLQPERSQHKDSNRLSLKQESSQMCDSQRPGLQPDRSQFCDSIQLSLQPEASQLGDSIQLSLQPDRSQLGDSNRLNLQPNRSQLEDSKRLSLKQERSQMGDSQRPGLQPERSQISESGRPSLQPERSQLNESNRPSLQPDRSQLSESGRPSLLPVRSQLSESNRPSLQPERSQLNESNRPSLQPEISHLGESNRPNLQPERSQLNESGRPSLQPKRSQLSVSSQPSLLPVRSQHSNSLPQSLQPERLEMTNKSHNSNESQLGCGSRHLKSRTHDRSQNLDAIELSQQPETSQISDSTRLSLQPANSIRRSLLRRNSASETLQLKNSRVENLEVGCSLGRSIHRVKSLGSAASQHAESIWQQSSSSVIDKLLQKPDYQSSDSTSRISQSSNRDKIKRAKSSFVTSSGLDDKTLPCMQPEFTIIQQSNTEALHSQTGIDSQNFKADLVAEGKTAVTATQFITDQPAGVKLEDCRTSSPAKINNAAQVRSSQAVNFANVVEAGSSTCSVVHSVSQHSLSPMRCQPAVAVVSTLPVATSCDSATTTGYASASSDPHKVAMVPRSSSNPRSVELVEEGIQCDGVSSYKSQSQPDLQSSNLYATECLVTVNDSSIRRQYIDSVHASNMYATVSQATIDNSSIRRELLPSIVRQRQRARATGTSLTVAKSYLTETEFTVDDTAMRCQYLSSWHESNIFHTVAPEETMDQSSVRQLYIRSVAPPSPILDVDEDEHQLDKVVSRRVSVPAPSPLVYDQHEPDEVRTLQE